MKILVIRFSSIGDIVLTTPVVRCLKKQLNAEVHFLTKKSYYSIVAHNPYIDRVHVLGSSLSKCVNKLKEENYDLIIDLHHNLRTQVIKSLLRKKSFSYPKLNFEKWLMVKLKIDRLPEEHIVDRYLSTCASLGVRNDGEGLDHFIPAKDEVHLSTLPPEFQNGYIAWVIGAKQSTKKFPYEKIISIIDDADKPVILLGGKEDRPHGKYISMGLIAGRQNIYNACGEYTIHQSASILKQANLVLTNDTGLMHIAAALRKKVISLWGNTIPEFGMYPYYGTHDIPSITMEVFDLPCRPCSKIGYDDCPKGHFKCMKGIKDDDVTKAIGKLY